jgi:hypothetical protein
MKNNKTIIWIILIALGLFVAYHFGIFQMFTLSPISIDPSTCQGLSLISETATLSDTVSQVCYPYSWRYPVVQIIYDAKTGKYLNTFQGIDLIWGASQSGQSSLVRCYRCNSAQIIPGSPAIKVLTDDKIANPLGQSTAFSNSCIVGQCQGGWECKSSSGGTYYEYTACNNSPINPIRFCGNGIAESGETQTNCCKDTGCPSGYECKSNTCTEIQYPQVCNNNQVCDYGENINNCPNDCTPGPHCGDGTCGTGENQNNCCTDCKCSASQQCIDNSCEQTSYACGNYVCDQGETPISCPLDCGAVECIEGQIEYIDCGIEGFKDNFWAYRQCLNGLWINVQQGTPCYCVGNNYCKPNYKCSNNVCVPDLPSFCSSSSDCTLSGYYCDTTSHKCLTCNQNIPECELSGFKCNSQNDCYGVSNNFCANWNCINKQCVESGKRFEGCCNDVNSCVGNQTCDNHVCNDIPTTPKAKPSILNIGITILIILGIAVGGYFLYKKTNIFKK